MAVIICNIDTIFNYFYQQLSKRTEKGRKKEVRVISTATKNLVNTSSEGDFSLAINVITENKRIPLILVDECDSILEHRNLLIYSKLDSLQ